MKSKDIPIDSIDETLVGRIIVNPANGHRLEILQVDVLEGSVVTKSLVAGNENKPFWEWISEYDITSEGL